MRSTRSIVTMSGALALFILSGLGPASAQEVGETLTLTGCLAQEAEEGEEVEYLLQNLQGTEIAVEEVELIPGEGVDLAPHVGHTVEVTGVVIADEDEAEEKEEEEEEGDDDELHLRVTDLAHISASCESSSGS